MSTHRINPFLSRSGRFGLVAMLLSIALFSVNTGVLGDDTAGAAGAPLWIYDSDLYVRHVETADLNGDTTLDVIGAEYSSDHFGEPSRVYAIDGTDGSTLWSYLLQDGVRSMTLADVSGDGVMDVVAGASYSASTPDGKVHAINGVTGSIIWTFNVGATIQDVAAADFDGDVFADVVIGSFDDFVYAIDGATGTQVWNKEISSLWINALDAVDVNSDGVDDVGFAHEYLTGFDNFLGVLDGTDGTPIWQLTVTYVVLDVMIADIDTDGTLEAVFGGATGDDRAFIYVRDALTGALEWQYELGPMDHTNGEISLYAYNVDGDADVDLVVGNSVTDRTVFAFEGDTPSPLWVSQPLGSFPKKLAFGDVTGDGNENVIAATWDRAQVIDATDGSKVWYYAVGGTIEGVAAGDFDNDGTLDVVASGGAEFSGSPPDPGKSIWALKTSDSPLWWEYAFGEYGNAIAIDNLNGDPALDVITVSSLDDKATAIDGATGALLWEWTGTENLYAVTTGDFDDNGIIDVAVAGNDDTVTALTGDLGTVMWQNTMPGDQVYRKNLESTDLDGNGSDEVIAGSDDNTIYALDGPTGTVFWSTPLGGDVEEIELAQMNGAGPLDVVAAIGWPGNRVVVLDGSNGSILWEYTTNVDYVRHVEVLDANGDGTLDVGFAVPKIGATPGRVGVLDGITHTELWSTAPFLPNSDYGLAHGDVDGDGAEELIAAGNSEDKSIHVFDGPSGSENWSYLCGGDVNVVRVADVDGDGRPEVIGGADDNIVHVIDGCSGDAYFTFSTAGDVMDIAIGDVSGDGTANVAATTFSSSGVAYVFRPFAETVSYVDQADPEFLTVDGTWRTKSYFKAYGGTVAFRPGGGGNNTAAWRLDRSGGEPFLSPGTYDVYSLKLGHPRLNQMATNAPFKVFDVNGSSGWIRIDQSTSGTEWQHLGTFEFDNDSPQGVLVSDDANGVVVADAIRLIRR